MALPNLDINSNIYGRYYLPSEFINSNYQYQFRMTQSYTQWFVRVYTNVDTTGGTVLCSPSSNPCIFYDVYFTQGNFVWTENSGRITNQTQYPILDSSRFTNDYVYRTDFDKSLVIFLILFIFIIFIPYKIISRLFGRWFKL